MRKRVFLIAKRIVLVLLLAAFALMVGFMIAGSISIARNPATSFPWYSAILFTAYYFAFPILLLLAAYLLLDYCYKKTM